MNTDAKLYIILRTLHDHFLEEVCFQQSVDSGFLSLFSPTRTDPYLKEILEGGIWISLTGAYLLREFKKAVEIKSKGELSFKMEQFYLRRYKVLFRVQHAKLLHDTIPPEALKNAYTDLRLAVQGLKL